MNNFKITTIAALMFAAASSLAGAAMQDGKIAVHSEHLHGVHGEDSSLTGKAGNPTKVNRTVTVDMNDAMRFTPASISVKEGEVIRFAVKNSGRLKHEMVIGSSSEIKEHARLMVKFPDMEHSEPNQVTLAPGKTGNIVWQFEKAGKVDFVCLQPGHFEAGMKGQIVVAPK